MEKRSNAPRGYFCECDHAFLSLTLKEHNLVSALYPPMATYGLNSCSASDRYGIHWSSAISSSNIRVLLIDNYPGALVIDKSWGDDAVGRLSLSGSLDSYFQGVSLQDDKIKSRQNVI